MKLYCKRADSAILKQLKQPFSTLKIFLEVLPDRTLCIAEREIYEEKCCEVIAEVIIVETSRNVN